MKPLKTTAKLPTKTMPLPQKKKGSTTAETAAPKGKGPKKRNKSAKRKRQPRPAPLSLELVSAIPSPPTLDLSTVAFEEALQLAPLFDAAGRASQARAEHAIKSELIQAGVITANAVVSVNSSMVVSFSANGIRGLKSGTLTLVHDASGNLLPSLKDGAGRIKELGRLSSNVATRAAALGAAIIGVAHMISGAAMAATLQEVQRDVKFLVAARTHDKLGRLEAIYAYSRELLAGPQSAEVQWELFRQTKELTEIRAQWRKDVQAKLDQVEDPKAKTGIVKSIWDFFTNGARKDAEKLQSETHSAVAELRYIDFSLALQYVLCVAVGREQPFLTLSLPSEVKWLGALSDQVKEKTNFLRNRGDNLDPTPLLKEFDALTARYRDLAATALRASLALPTA